MFGLSSSPFVFDSDLKHHLGWYKKDQLKTVMNLKQSMYVNDVIETRGNLESAKTFKENIPKIFNETGFKLYKWHSNFGELKEVEGVSQKETDETYAKQQLSKGDT